jgi:hypothetical protein
LLTVDQDVAHQVTGFSFQPSGSKGLGDRCPYWLTAAFVKTNNLPPNEKYTPADEINTEVMSHIVN